MGRTLDWNEYIEKATQTVAEGVVMLKNNDALPLKKDAKVSVFGRIQLHYYKSGTGSGGMVNVSRVIGIVDGLVESGVAVNEKLLDIYKKWDAENPFDQGHGWGTEPWAQKEMPLTDEVVKAAAAVSDTAIAIIGRTAGEEQDSKLSEGSYLLTELEKDMIAKARKYFKKVVVLLNVGNIIDMEELEAMNPDAILYVWQGGMVGGAGVAEVLTGKISPSGKLPDTIAYKVSDYASARNFGDPVRDFYCEDIYVGYRYFETFAKDKVRYPFGFGLSYTKFTFDIETVKEDKDSLIFNVKVANVGEYAGKEVVQVYAKAPQGQLGKAERVLCGFEKTATIEPGQSAVVSVVVDKYMFASYDDCGCSGHAFCYVLEAGDYELYVGPDVRSAKFAYKITLNETEVLKEHVQAMAPVLAFDRLKPVATENGYEESFVPAPLLQYDEAARRLAGLPAEIAQTENKGFKLNDVRLGKCTLEEFVAQFTDNDLACIIRGEGMGSPRVTAGTASAFGGVADGLCDLGIPAACCSDGPSGMRLDCGTKAFSLPNGTMLASTFNKELLSELFFLVGQEMTANKVECLLGPGMNIHRHPLNGRNFEYFSEDPFLTGYIAAAQLKGMHKAGVTGAIKHFCGNNQEYHRHDLDSVVSERALREIYLKGFEIAVKEGNAKTIMTTYGSVNGVWTAGNYDLNTTILRNEWGFTGFTMTDWWANINRRNQAPDKADFAAMAMAQNDVYMVCAEGGNHFDNTLESLEKGELTRGELMRNAMNVCRFLLDTNAMKRLAGEDCSVKIINRGDEGEGDDKPVEFYTLDGNASLDFSEINTDKGSNHSFGMIVENAGFYKVTVTASSTQSELAQIPVTFFSLGTAMATFTWNGTGGKPVSFSKVIPMFSRYTALRLYFAQSGLKIHSVDFEYTNAPADPAKLVED